MVDFNVKIGMKFSEIETVIKQYGKENESAAKSIFNMIKDEKEYGGDQKITNHNELKMVVGYLQKLFSPNEKQTHINGIEVMDIVEEEPSGVQMPDVLANAEPEATEKGLLIEGTYDGQKLTYSNKEWARSSVTYKLEDGKSVYDLMTDYDKDGDADDRVMIVREFDEKGSPVKASFYEDRDLDGQFETKRVREPGKPSEYYVRAENGDWEVPEWRNKNFYASND